MKFSAGYLYIALAVVFWGLWGIFGKIATHYHKPLALMMWVNLLGLVTVPGLFWLARAKGLPLELAGKGLWWALGTAVVASLGGVTFYFALEKAPASVVVPVTAAYPAVTVLLAVVFLRERFTWPQAVGLAAILLGVMLVSWQPAPQKETPSSPAPTAKDAPKTP